MESQAILNHSLQGKEWFNYYNEITKQGHVPDATLEDIGQNKAVFRGMYQDLSEIKNAISSAGLQPVVIVIYADVLVIPENFVWSLNAQGIVIYARRIETNNGATIILDYLENEFAKLIVFGLEFQGSLLVKAAFSADKTPQLFDINEKSLSPGFMIASSNKTASLNSLDFKSGFALEISDNMHLYLNNSFIYGSLLYDQNPDLAVSIFQWIKDWAAQNNEFQELFYRCTSIGTLLKSELNAKKNGARFVPYLSSSIYTKLASSFVASASKYESDYMTIRSQSILTSQNIALAKTMVENSSSEISYVNALIQQAQTNYNNAVNAQGRALSNFKVQQRAVEMVSIDFQKIGIPEYQTKVILEGVVKLLESVVSFGAAIALMAVGDEAAAPGAAEAAVGGAEAVAKAASSSAELAKQAEELIKTMTKLKNLVEILGKMYSLAQTVNGVASNIGSAESKINVIQKMQDATNGVDLSDADSWKIYQIQATSSMKDPVDLKIRYAKEYQDAMDILVVYGQALSASQLAVIKTGQELAALTFQLHYAQEKQANLKKLVDQLQDGEKASLTLMQQLYQKYLNSKSSLFSALKLYQASYFYWALSNSKVQPRIIDSVNDLDAGINQLTQISMDEATALERFNPPPQVMKNMTVVISDPEVLQNLKDTQEATWVLPLSNSEFRGIDRVRLDDIRVWIEGVEFNGTDGSVFMTISNSGNYLDRYTGLDFQFNSKSLSRTFEYRVTDNSRDADWSFENGKYGLVQIDGAVDHEVSYAYFRPTPFSEWSISLKKNNPGVDLSKVSRITMYFAGTAIGSSTSGIQKLTTKQTDDVTVS